MEITKKGPKYRKRGKKDEKEEKKHKRSLAILGASLGSSFGGLGLGILGHSLWTKMQTAGSDGFIKNLDKLDVLPKRERAAMEDTLTSINQWANDLTRYAYEHPEEVNLDYLNIYAVLGVLPNYELDPEFEGTYRMGVPPEGWKLPPGVRLAVLDLGGTAGVPPKPPEPIDVQPLVPPPGGGARQRGAGRGKRPPGGVAISPDLPTIPEEPEPADNPPAPAGNPPAPAGNPPAPAGNLPAPAGNLPAPAGNPPASAGNPPAPTGTPGPNVPPAANPMPTLDAPWQEATGKLVMPPAIPNEGP